MDLSIFSAVAGGLNQAYHSAKALLDLKVEAETAARINDLAGQLGDLMGKFLAAQTAHITCQERAMSLEKEMARFKTFETEKQRYALTQLGDHSFAYALRPEAAGEEPPHYICAHCYVDCYKSLLQRVSTDWNDHVLMCPRCKSETRIPHGIPMFGN